MNLSDTTTQSAHDNVIELETAANNNSKYVEIINTNNNRIDEKTEGMALSEVGKHSFVDPMMPRQDAATPLLVRYGLFGYSNENWRAGSYGEARDSVTFRPVVWN